MSALAVASREGARFARSSPIRAAVVAMTITAATVFGVLVDDLALACGALAVSVLVVARRSPRPERFESANAWARAGAGRFPIWASSTVEALLLGWTATLAGAGLAQLVRHFTNPNPSVGRQGGYVAAQLCALALVACAPTGHVRPARRRPALRRVARTSGVVVRVLVISLAITAMVGIATHVRSDFELALGGAAIVVLLAIVGAIVGGPVTDRVVSALGRAPRLGPMGTIAAGRRTPATVRLVVASALTVAIAAVILGASVQARPETIRALDERLARLPVLPTNVALVRLDSLDSQAYGSSSTFAQSELSPELRAALVRAVPGADVVEVHHIGIPSFSPLCGSSCRAGPFVVEDPRLRLIYGSDVRYPVPPTLLLGAGQDARLQSAGTRVPPRNELARMLHDGEPLPPESFAGAAYYEVPPDLALQLNLPIKVRTLFLRAPRPLTDTQLAQLSAITRFVAPAPATQLTLIGPRGQISPPPVTSNPKDHSLRHAPWAATSPASRWSVAVVAGLLALLALFATLAIDTIDRRRDVQRLERLGATPGQVRGAAALHSIVLFVVMAWLNAFLVTWLVRAGTHAFNHDQPGIPVPFTMPWAVILLLTVALPALAGGAAALVARPRRQERNIDLVRRVPQSQG